MEYVQERIATLHDFGEAEPGAPTERAAVVVPLTVRDYASPAAEGVFSTLATIDIQTVIVAVRAPPDRMSEIATWLSSFDLPLSILWCNAPGVRSTLASAGLDGREGKGRDVWLALGIAAEQAEYVVVHDGDVSSYAPTHVPRLLYPLTRGYDFSKAYYARIENDRLYGRLFRLFFTPLLGALGRAHDASILAYLDAFRYALAGEFAMTADLARELTVPRGWGLEVGTLGDAYRHAGFGGTAQVDLGVHEHEHRAVSGPEGLGDMAQEVSAVLFEVLETNGVTPAYESLPRRYRQEARTLIDQYATDAAFNGLEYDRVSERDQVETYASAIAPPPETQSMPSWTDTSLDPSRLGQIARDALDERIA